MKQPLDVSAVNIACRSGIEKVLDHIEIASQAARGRDEYGRLEETVVDLEDMKLALSKRAAEIKLDVENKEGVGVVLASSLLTLRKRCCFLRIKLLKGKELWLYFMRE